MERADGGPQPGSDAADARLNLKALRLATHGWLLGNPLVYKPGAADLCAVARELASAGVASGALVLSDTRPDSADRHDLIHAVLILRPAIPRAPLGMAAARSVAEVAQAALGRPCAVRRQWDVVLRGDGQSSTRRLCRVSVEQREDDTLVSLRFTLASLGAAGLANAQPAAFFARPDWREVFLARTLHTLDNRLRALLAA